MKVQFGTADKYKEGFINCDVTDKFGKVDRIIDLNVFPYPFEDNSIDFITHNHTMEHLEYPEKFVDECYRILKKGGVMDFVIPYKNLYGTIHKYSFCFAYFESFDKNPKNIWGKKFNRGSGWQFVDNLWEDVEIKYLSEIDYCNIMGGKIVEKIINSCLFMKRWYDFFGFNYFRISSLRVVMRK